MFEAKKTLFFYEKRNRTNVMAQIDFTQEIRTQNKNMNI